MFHVLKLQASDGFTGAELKVLIQKKERKKVGFITMIPLRVGGVSTGNEKGTHRVTDYR